MQSTVMLSNENEAERLKSLESFSIMDTMDDEDYNNITAIASAICETPISLISLVDERRQWFKSNHGLNTRETPKHMAFCAHAIQNPYEFFVVSDSREDERFVDNPLVIGDPNVIFYAGIPLVVDDGLALGTLCVIDNKPRELSQKQKDTLSALAIQTINLLKLRRRTLILEEALIKLEDKNQELEKFAYIAAHDIKSPLNNISGLTKIFSAQYQNKLDEEGMQLLSLIESSSEKLRKLVDGLLNHSKSENLAKEPKIWVNLKHALTELRSLFSSSRSIKITLNTALKEVHINKTAGSQILINLVSNAIKYNDKETTLIEIGVAENETHYLFYVQDNGPGIPLSQHPKVFKIFETIASKDRFGVQGNGIGLATVKKLIISLGGQISIDKSFNKGTKFNFSLAK